MVLEGTYLGPVVTRASGRVDAPIVYVSETPLAAHIDGDGAYSAWENYGDYVEIVGFDVFGSTYLGIVSRGSNVSIVGNWVHDLLVPTCNEPNGGAGINHADYASHGNLTIGNVVSHIRAPAHCTRLVHGIYHSNRGGAIFNNLVFDVTFAGIQTWHSANEVVISNNLVMGARVGIIVASTNGPADGFLIANNILVDNEVGVEESGSSYGPNNRYLNNLLFHNGVDYLLKKGSPIGSIISDPGFLAPAPSPSGDFRLRDDSPAIDAASADGAPPFDFRGLRRPQGEASDIGPFEWCPANCLGDATVNVLDYGEGPSLLHWIGGER